MKEYIEREALLKKSETMHDGQRCCLAVREGYIYTAPSADVVEVVRCKDCKYYGTSGCAMDTYAFDVVEEGFCSYGERKEV